VSGERFVDRVVDDLEDQVVETTLGGVPDVHPGALPHGLETLENLDGLGPVTLRWHAGMTHSGNDFERGFVATATRTGRPAAEYTRKPRETTAFTDSEMLFKTAKED
jgi:hypothetical protein